jgi:hypothetical protein
MEKRSFYCAFSFCDTHRGGLSFHAFVTIGRAQKSNNVPSAAGLGLIVFAIFVFDADTPFPGVYALGSVVVPC